ncbi:MAG: aspartyl/glutamyl-tRNA amidotransferase subunit C [SAR324 cluster bacterium]|nr:aspartyl/glutamyl-tRNA amidotransferase subunit C [SAR324 cluster bacterium]
MDKDLAQVRRIANLARIKIEKHQEQDLVKKFSAIKNYFDELSKLDIKDEEIKDESNLVTLHEDVVCDSKISLSFSDYLSNNMFVVPKVIE